jgi:hypothetical protein
MGLMRKLYIVMLFWGICTIISAQEMSVKSFYLAETDLTANTPGTIVYDQNGNLCALIKLETSVDGFSFDVGSLGVREVRRVGGEIWIYVPYGIRRMTLSHQQLGVIRDYLFPCNIEKGRTYVMTLVAGTVRTIVEYATSKQFLHITLNPNDAILEINGKIKATNDGVYQELLPFGKYEYKAYCQNYHDQVGVIQISDPNNTHEVELKLKPAFGHISVNASKQPEIAGSAVYVDEKYIGTIPLNNIQISSGIHRVKIIKELYEAYNEEVEIVDGLTTTLMPCLNPDFAEIILTTSKGADIYINGELKGRDTWSGKLACGSYMFETRQQGYLSYKTSYEISRNEHNKTIAISGPTPIYGSLVISSTPSKAKIYLDGEYIGETPKYISKQIIGSYSISVELEGYDKQTQNIDITEGNETELSLTLNKSEVRTTAAYDIFIKVGELIKINAPSKVTIWESENNSRATVDANGVVTGVSVGRVTLWAHLSSGDMKMYTVTISSNDSQYSNSNNTLTNYSSTSNSTNTQTHKIKLRSTRQLYTTAGNSKVLRWESENTNVATVNANGVVTGKSRGTATIWAHLGNDEMKRFIITVY